MKKLIIVAGLLWLSSFQLIKAQDLDLKWSEKFLYDNKRDGFFHNFIDANSKYVYARFTNYAQSERKREKKMICRTRNLKTWIITNRLFLKTGFMFSG